MTNVSFARPSTSIAEIILPETGVLAIDDLDCLADRLERANDDEALRVLVVRSAADVFSSGADPTELASIDDLVGLSATVTRFFEALIGCDKIMIAAVDGPCTGLGMTMLLHFDAVLATDAARFSAPFVELGLVPEAASTLLAVRRFGYLRAFDLFCGGGEIDVAEAMSIGLVGEHVARGELLATTRERAIRLARKPPIALTATRRLLRATEEARARCRAEIELFEECLRSATTRRRLTLVGHRRTTERREAAA